jgi:hypothetical protein
MHFFLAAAAVDWSERIAILVVIVGVPLVLIIVPEVLTI